ncbi:hypothetical protein SH668x_002490 [Planctomicrobium sp. SH668]|uniref:hypothetical protein n=1 Tax=Planctomicrobium sp. SH668 TaxID=3448126 RepID=UPI003F5B13BF
MKLLVIGRTEGVEHIVASAETQVDSSHRFESIGAAIESNLPAELLLVLQHWSDEYSPEEIRGLLETFPLARVVVSQGPWSVSDRRTRQYWPAAMCVAAESAQRRIAQEFEVLAGKRAPLPWTAGIDEIFAFDFAEPVTAPFSEDPNGAG